MSSKQGQVDLVQERATEVTTEKHTRRSFMVRDPLDQPSFVSSFLLHTLSNTGGAEGETCLEVAVEISVICSPQTFL